MILYLDGDGADRADLADMLVAPIQAFVLATVKDARRRFAVAFGHP